MQNGKTDSVVFACKHFHSSLLCYSKSNNNALTLLVEQRVKIQCTQVHTGRPVEELAKPGTT